MLVSEKMLINARCHKHKCTLCFGQQHFHRETNIKFYGQKQSDITCFLKLIALHRHQYCYLLAWHMTGLLFRYRPINLSEIIRRKYKDFLLRPLIQILVLIVIMLWVLMNWSYDNFPCLEIQAVVINSIFC